MLNLSTAFKNELNNDNRNYLCYADITLSDGTVLNLKNKDIWTGGMTIEDAVSNTSSFDIGSAIINKLTLVINNIYETYSEYDFTDAIVVPYVGLELPDGTIEKIRKGVFTVDDPSYNGSLITLVCLDEMYKLDYPYSKSSLVYPATIGEIVRDICFVCGVNLLTTTFFNSSYVVQERPEDDSLTCRQVLAWAAQIACSWARFDTYGRLRPDWYDQSVFEIRDGLNGGIFDEASPYATGDNAHGGTFKPWTRGDNYSGGTFKELTGYHHIYSMSSMQICTDDVVVTGVKVTESFEETDTEKVQSFLYGSEGYVLSIEGNDLIQQGAAREIAQSIGEKVVGLRFRPLDVSALNDPSIEAGDPVYVTDRKGRSYQSFVTSTTFRVGNYQQIQCSAETPSRNNAQRFSEATRNLVQARREASQKISNYDKAVQLMTSIMANSMGMYETVERTENGGIIVYQHDKPLLSDSKKIWKKSEEGFVCSTDGGKNWNAGWTVDGNIVANVLSVIGINFDWAKGGTLTLGGENNNNGVLKVWDALGNEVGRWTKDGISVRRGSIKGTTLELGGSENKDGYLVVNDASGEIVCKIDKEGLNLLKGIIKGTVVTLGGKGNADGYVEIKDENGKTVTRLDKDGLTAKKGTFSGTLDAADGTFYGIMSILATKRTGENPFRVKIPDYYYEKTETAGATLRKKEFYTYISAGTDGFQIARNRPGNRRYIRFYTSAATEEEDGIPIMSGGTFSSFSEKDYTMSGMQEQVKIHADGEFKSEWTYNNATSSGANTHISSNGIFRRSSSSSRRYKMDESTDLKNLDPSPLYDMPVKTFKYKEGYLNAGDPREGKDILGFVVEDLLKHYPLAVDYENGLPETWNARIMIPAMLKLIQEQNKRISKIENRRGWKRRGRR